MSKLNQIVAVVKGVKSDANATFTGIYHKLQKPALFAGIQRTYRPRDEDGERLPGEGVKVQLRAEDLLVEASAALTRMFDVVATNDLTNGVAKADVIVDGVTLLEQLPVSTLLFLEKQLTDIKTVVGKLPLLDPTEDWELDDVTSTWKSSTALTTRTKKVPRTLEKAKATDKHPAQVEVWMEDTVVGDWATVKYSGAVPQRRVNELLDKVEKLRQAVKFAREQANGVEAVDLKIGAKIFGYLFA